MPTPIEVLFDPISLSFLGIYGALILLEAVAPARALPKVPWWHARTMINFSLYFFLAAYLPMLWDPVLANVQLFDLSGLGIWGGAFVGIILFEAGIYFWHRALHTSGVLWHVFHQFHHSAERVDTFGTFYFSPMDTAGFAFVGSISLTLLIGIDPQAITIYLLVTTFLAIFQHTNIKTPQWLGYLIQRPESHSVHHARSIHFKNFSDLPIFDMLFGTFENPKDFYPQAGFYDGASSRMFEMFTFQDVSKLPLGQAPNMQDH